VKDLISGPGRHECADRVLRPPTPRVFGARHRPACALLPLGEVRHDVECGLHRPGEDGFHGISPAASRRPWSSTRTVFVVGSGPGRCRLPQLIYARSCSGFALHSLRSPSVSRLLLQFHRRDLAGGRTSGSGRPLRERLGVPGWHRSTTPVLGGRHRHAPIFVSFADAPRPAVPGRDAAHIVPPTRGREGLNLAWRSPSVPGPGRASCVSFLGPWPIYSDDCLARFWRATHFFLLVDDDHASPGPGRRTRWTPIYARACLALRYPFARGGRLSPRLHPLRPPS